MNHFRFLGVKLKKNTRRKRKKKMKNLGAKRKRITEGKENSKIILDARSEVEEGYQRREEKEGIKDLDATVILVLRNLITSRATPRLLATAAGVSPQGEGEKRRAGGRRRLWGGVLGVVEESE